MVAFGSRDVTRRQPRTQVHVGTSGWTYPDWAGRVYPSDVRGSDRLLYYARHFDAVELNATFYRLPTPAMVRAWSRLPRSFRLAAKAPRWVTEMRKLANCDEETRIFLERISQVPALRVVLWQLPPSLGPDLDRLDRFLAGLPRNVRHAVEFRHSGWWNTSVVKLLRRHRTAFVAVSHPRLPDTVFQTTDLVYARFHGLGDELYRHDYSRAQLAAWIRRLRGCKSARHLYVFFNNDYSAHAVHNAKLFRDLWRKAVGRGQSRSRRS